MSEKKTEENVKKNSTKSTEADYENNEKENNKQKTNSGSDKKDEGREKKEKKPEKLSPEEQCREFENKYKRALADYQNLLKRTAEEKQAFAKYANEGMIRDILPVYDNLRISLDHIDDEAKNNGLAEGIKYVVKQFRDALLNNGVSEIEIKDKKFDPMEMEAISGKGKKIKKIIKPGYKLNGKVIVAAKVELE
jgi:molecular chaperone GrpE